MSLYQCKICLSTKEVPADLLGEPTCPNRPCKGRMVERTPVEAALLQSSREAARIIQQEQDDPAAKARIERVMAAIHAESAVNLERMEKGVIR